MRKMKKLIATLSAALMLFSFTAPAMAADTAAATVSKAAIGKDVKGTKYENDAKKLIALGIINGFEDGTVRPDATVTRAQFAAIVAQELGIAGDAGQSTTKFKDVPASHWASGVINLAVGKGIIVGFGDGTFRPDAPVTYAQAYAMLTQMLGWGPALKDTSWPAGVLAKAASIGVSTGVKGGANAEMKRGDVIIAAANALEADRMDQSTWGTDNNFTKADTTLLEEVFDITIVDNKDNDRVTDVPMTQLGTLDANEIEIDNTNVYEVSPVYNPNDYLGEEVEYWVDEDDDYVYYIANSGDEKVVYDVIDSVDGTNITLDNEDDYDLPANVVYNFEGATAASVAGSIEGANVKLVVDDSDDVVEAIITDFDASDVDVVEEVTSDENIEGYNGNVDIDLEDDDVVIVKDGLPAALADVKQGDVVNVFDMGTDKEIIYVTSTQVKGEADVNWDGDEEDIANYTVEVSGVEYDVDGRATYSDDANDSVGDLSYTDLQDLNGEEVTLYLDAKGDVAHIVSGEVETNKLVAVVTKDANYDDEEEVVRINLTNTKGVETSYEFELDEADLNGEEATDVEWEAIDAGAIVEYKLDSAGKLSNVEVVTDEYEEVEFDANEDDKSITTTGDVNGDYGVTDDTVILDMIDPTDVTATTWEAIKAEDDVFAYVKVDGSEVTEIFVTGVGAPGTGSITSDAKYAVVLGLTTVGDDKDKAVKLLLPDGKKETVVYEGTTPTVECYEAIGAPVTGFAKGQFISYELDSDGEIDSATIIAVATPNGETITGFDIDDEDANVVAGVVTDKKSGSLKIGSTFYTTNSETKIFNISDKDDLGLGSVNKDDYVLFIDTDDSNRSADFIIVVAEDVQ